MSEENTSQENTEEVVSHTSDNIGIPAEEVPADKTVEDTLYDGGEDEKEDKPEESSEKSTEDDKEEKPEGGEDQEDKESKDEKNDEGDKGDSKEEYTLERSEGSFLDEADMERIASYAKEQGLSKEAAEKLLESQDQAVSSFHERTKVRHSEMVEDWAKQCREDKEIGGEKYEQSVGRARLAVQKFGSVEFAKALTETGFGNNPEVVRTFARIGKLLEDDTHISTGADKVPAKSAEDLFYGKE